MSESNDLITKYRPRDFDSVIGQVAVVKSLKALLKRKTSRAFLFCGPVGTGKTTLARIVAASVGCDPRNIREVDGASSTGVESMRELTQTMGYSAMGTSKGKFYIIDEAHKISSSAMSALLKATEEPPPNCYWAFCTSEPQKLTKAIWTRFSAYTLSPVSTNDITDLLTKVTAAEGWDTPEEVLFFIAQKAGGSPRQALSSLAVCVRCKDRAEAAEVLRTVEDDNEEVIALCRELIKGPKGTTWGKVMDVLKKMGDVDAEGVRRVVLAYFSKVAAGTGGSVGYALDVLEAFEKDYPTGNNQHCLLISLGKLLL